MDEKEMVEALTEATPVHSDNELPEAPASANVRITSPNKFTWQFTLRDTKAASLLRKMKVLEDNFLGAGWTPSGSGGSSSSTNKTDAKICPKCGSEMWDNRPKKAAGEFKATSPDFRCKNDDCKHVIWPPKK